MNENGTRRVLMISACLLGIRSTYKLDHHFDQRFLDWIQEKEFDAVIPVCPEQLGGFPTPRPPAEVSWNSAGFPLVLREDGTDVTPEFLRGADGVERIVELFGVTQALLKSHSPSCSPCGVYSQNFSGRLVPGMGVAAKRLADCGVSLVSSDDLLV